MKIFDIKFFSPMGYSKSITVPIHSQCLRLTGYDQDSQFVHALTCEANHLIKLFLNLNIKFVTQYRTVIH